MPSLKPSPKYIPRHDLKIGDWYVLKTVHSNVREKERFTDKDKEVPGGIDGFMKKVVDRLGRFQKVIKGEYLYWSPKLNQGMVLNVDPEFRERDDDDAVKQIRVITILPPGKSNAKPGTKKIMVEGIEYTVIDLDAPITLREFLGQ